MAHQSVWFQTQLPVEIVNLIEKDCSLFENSLNHSALNGNVIAPDVRNSENTWIGTEHWIAGFIWHYAMRANRENFLYDLDGIDAESMQLTNYAEGQYYKWHVDSGISACYKPMQIASSSDPNPTDFIGTNSERIRKLSFTVQLSNYDEYTGGDFQLIDDHDKTYFAPKTKGTIVFFDSRSKHRVRKVTSGVRKSLVGWIVGPRWR